MSLQSSLSVLIPSLFGVFLAITVSAGVGCSHYSYTRATANPCNLSVQTEQYEDIVGEWVAREKEGARLHFGYFQNGKRCLSFENVEYPLIRKGPGHYLLKEGFYVWKGVLITFLNDRQMSVTTNDGRRTITYDRKL